MIVLFNLGTGVLARTAPALKSSLTALGKTTLTFAKQSNFSGNVFVAHGNSILFSESFGTARHDVQVPVDAQTRFQVGSISKWFTTLLVLKLADEHKLSLSRPIAEYLPGYPTAVGDLVTVADLLSNTSGIQDRLPTEMINRPDISASTMSAAKATTIYGYGPLVFRPGTKFDYSHTNWMIVQALIEQVSGKSFEQFFDETLVGPYALADTGVTHGSFVSVSHGAIAYASSAPNAATDVHLGSKFVIPTGTLYSNGNDLIRLAHAVYQGKLLSPASLAALDTVRWKPEDYALGGRVMHRRYDGQSKTLAFEIGSMGGFKSLLVHVIQDDISIVVLNNTNMSEDDLSAFADHLLDQVYGHQAGVTLR